MLLCSKNPAQKGTSTHQGRGTSRKGKIKAQVWALPFSPYLIHTIGFKSKYDTD